MFWITNMTNYYLFYVIIAIWEWIVQYFSSYLHDEHCILLITSKRILYVNKLTWKYNVFISMTWKWSLKAFFFLVFLLWGKIIKNLINRAHYIKLKLKDVKSANKPTPRIITIYKKSNISSGSSSWVAKWVILILFLCR